MPAPTRPLTISPVMIGPLSLIMENTMTAGRKDLAPNRIKLSRVCRDRTTPVAAPPALQAAATLIQSRHIDAGVRRIHTEEPGRRGTDAHRKSPIRQTIQIPI